MKVESLNELIIKHDKELLLCGGAAGHLQHLYDNLDLTFGEIKDIIANASDGKLEKVSEKLDGMNLVFTWDVGENQLRVARNGSDIKNGGMDASALAKKFFGRGNVEDAFNSAFTVLNNALHTLTPQVLKKIFGNNGNVWYSIEIIYTKNPGTINYDNNNVVFHGWPIFSVKNGAVERSNDDSGIDLLTSKIEQMQKAVGMKNWRIRGPSLLNMKKLSDGSIAKKAISEIENAMNQAGVSDDDSILDYLENLMNEEVADLDLPPNVAKMVVARSLGISGAPGIQQIKGTVAIDKQQNVVTFIKASDALKKRMIQPIEMAIHRFAIEVLRGLNSTLIDRSDEEIARLKAQVLSAMKAIEASGNQAAIHILQKEMQRLGSVENIGAAMEGVVFFYNGQAYKFTGAFAPAHQILSLFRYGRKGVPKANLGEVRLRTAIKRLLRGIDSALTK